MNDEAATGRKDSARVTSSAQLASISAAALYASTGITGTISQLAKTSLASTAMTDFGKTSAAAAALHLSTGMTDTISQLAKTSLTYTALFAGAGMADTVSQLPETLAAADVRDFGLMSATALMALSRPSFGVLGSAGFGYPPAAWAHTASGNVTRSAEHDSVGESFLRRPDQQPACAYDESVQRQNRLGAALLK